MGLSFLVTDSSAKELNENTEEDPDVIEMILPWFDEKVSEKL